MLFRKPCLDDLNITYVAGNSNKAPVVFLHGNSQNSSCGYGLLHFFSERGHSTLTYDLPGHGGSAWGPFDYCFDHLIALNRQVIERYAAEHPILCGHSFGGMIQAATAIEMKPKPSSLILLGSLDCNPIEAAQLFNEAELSYLKASLDDYLKDAPSLFKQQKFYDYFANRHLEDAFIEIINRRYSQPDACRLNLTSLTGFNCRPQLSQLSIPILVIHGTQETVIPKPLVEAMAAHYSSMTVEWLLGAGHNGFFQQHKVTEEILNRHYLTLAGLNRL
jgi:pimeloyl-ACP methyl ester carboxylesterase